MSHRHRLLAGCLAISLACTPVQAELDNDEGGTYFWSAGYVSVISPACLQFRVVGICIWIICYYGNCEVEYSLKYGHFNPEAMVEVTNPQGIDRVEDPKRIDTHNRNHNNLINQDAAAFGHPLSGQIYCPSHADAAEYHFISRIDIPAWRWGGLDTFTLGALIPGLSEIGRWPLYSWGNLYPRTGWTIQSSEPKSAGIVAQRVGDIITRTAQAHIYNPISGEDIFIEDQKFTWAPNKGLSLNSNQYGWWQMAYPPDPSCVVMGKNDLIATRDWGGGKVSGGGDYAFTLYRPYKCCEIKKGFLIDIDFMPFPMPIVTN